ncbi:ABC transporter ATP-binding protein [Planctomycetaceae bacterium SH139]
MKNEVPPALLEIKALRYCYGQRVAVNEIEFTVKRGEIFGLLGPNGAGKTTTIQCIAGLRGDWQGSMLFDGQDFRPAAQGKARLRLGFVPQELAIYEGLTARENLTLFAKLSGIKRHDLAATVRASLQLAGLETRADEVTSKFSGGMKRRLNLAIGQVHHPELLLLDEPTVGVDPQSRNHLFDTLENLKQQGMTLLYTTHYMEEAERLCDRIGVMHEGHVVAIGTIAELGNLIGQPGAELETIFLHLTGRSLRDHG